MFLSSKTNSQERIKDHKKLLKINKVVLNKSNSVKPINSRKTNLIPVNKSNLNSTREKIKETSFLSATFHSPGYSKGKKQMSGIVRHIQKKTLSTKSNLSRDTSKNNRNGSKLKMLNDITVSDHDKTFTDRPNSRTPKPIYGKSLTNSKTPRIKNSNVLNLKNHIDNNSSKLEYTN